MAVRLSIILLFLLPVIAQAQLKSEFIGICTFDDFTNTTGDNYRGDILNFIDRYNIGVTTKNIQVGDEIIDGSGDVFEILTVHSTASNFEADVTVQAKLSNSGAPTGSGQVYRPTANGIIPPGSIDNLGLSSVTKGLIDMHNALRLDSLLGTVANGDSIIAVGFANDSLSITMESDTVYTAIIPVDSLHQLQADSIAALYDSLGVKVDTIIAGNNINITSANGQYTISAPDPNVGTDDQTAGEVWYNDSYLPLNVNDVQQAIDSLKRDLDAVSSGASDGVATAGSLDVGNEEIDVTVAAPGSVFSIDLSAIETLGSFSGWDTDASDDFDGAWGSLTGVPAGFADNVDDVDDADADATNEGSLTVATGSTSTAVINSNTSGSTGVTIEAQAGIGITENTGTGIIFIENTGDLDATNEIDIIGFSGDVGSAQQIGDGEFLDLEGGFGVVTTMSTDRANFKVDTTQVATVYSVGDTIANLTSGVTDFEELAFNTAEAPALSPGMMGWNSDENTVDIALDNDVTLQVGQEMLYYVKNQTGSTINDGQVVQFSGSLGASGRLLIALARADTTSEAKYIMGIATEEIANGADGFVTAFGKIRNIDTDGSVCSETWADGDILYLSATTAGCLTKTPPAEPSLHIPIAAVVHAANNGTLFVRPTYYPKLDDIHDVTTDGATNGQVLVYNSSTGVWEPGSTSGGTGWLKDSLAVGDVTIPMNRNQLSFSSDIPFGGSNIDTLISLTTPRVDASIKPYFLVFNYGSNSAGFFEQDSNLQFFNTQGSEGIAYAGDYFNATPVANLKDRQIPDIQTVDRMITASSGSAFWEDASGTVRTVSASSGLDFVFGSSQLDDSGNVAEDEKFLFDNSKGYFFAGSATDTVANDAYRGFYSASFGLNNIASGYTSSVTGGERNIASGNDSHIGGGQNNTATNLGTVVAGGRLNTNESLYGSIGGGTLNEIPNTSAEYATIPGGYKAKAELYGALTHASGSFDTDSTGQAQNMQVTLRGEGTGTSDFDLFLDGGIRRATIPNNAFWSLTGTCITVVVDIGTSTELEEGDSNADLLTGKAQNYEGTVTTDIGVVGGTGLYDDPDGDMIQSGVLITPDDTNNALKVTCTPPSAVYGGTATTVTRAACTLMITQLKY